MRNPAPTAILPLLAWLSPSYPVGAYAYSHGLEWAVEAGDVADETSLRGRVQERIHFTHGGARGVLHDRHYG